MTKLPKVASLLTSTWSLVLPPLLAAGMGACDLGIHPVSTVDPAATSTASSCDASGTVFGGGSGTAGDPYTICSRAHLASIAGAYLTKYFIQTVDINLGGIATPWSPIAASFTGTYDGNSKTISGLYYNTAAVSDVGLFKIIGAGGVVKNLTLSGVDITVTGLRTGALAGRVTNGTIQNCRSTGTISGGSTAGGLIGQADTASAISSSSSSVNLNSASGVGGLTGTITGNATITSSYATGTVAGTGGSVGGLSGVATGTVASNQIQSSYATGNVSGVGTSCGGLVGALSTLGVLNSYATGSVSGNGSIGGLVGNCATNSQISGSYAMTGSITSTAVSTGGLVGYSNFCNILKSYAMGTVSGTTRVGGLVGETINATYSNSYAQGAVTGDQVGGLLGAAQTLTITYSYSTGAVTGTGLVTGGLLGQSNGGNSFTNCYWDTVTSGQGASAAGTGLTTAQMQDFNNFTGWDFVTIWNGATYGGSGAVYPFLR